MFSRAPASLGKSGLVGAAGPPPHADNVNWSPDGRWLSFFTAKGLWLMSTASGKPRLAVGSRGWGRTMSRAVAWSPTSSELAYAGVYPFGKRTKLRQQPWITRLAVVTTGGARTQLWHTSLTYVSGNSQEPPRWSPDGTSLIFAARAGAGSISSADSGAPTAATALSACVPGAPRRSTPATSGTSRPQGARVGRATARLRSNVQ